MATMRTIAAQVVTAAVTLVLVLAFFGGHPGRNGRLRGPRSRGPRARSGSLGRGLTTRADISCRPSRHRPCHPTSSSASRPTSRSTSESTPRSTRASSTSRPNPSRGASSVTRRPPAPARVRHRPAGAHPDQLPRGRGHRGGGRDGPGHALRRLGLRRAGRRPRRVQRRRRPADQGPCRQALPGGHGRLVTAPGRAEDPGPGQPVRARADADNGDHQQPRPVVASQERPDDQGDHPDRRGNQPGQLGRPAPELRGAR